MREHEPRQVVFVNLGENSCYLSCLVDIAEEFNGDQRIDTVMVFLHGQKLGYVRDDCYLNLPEKVLFLMTGKAWVVRKEKSNYSALPNEYEVQRWEHATTSKTYSHFIRPKYDPLGDSNTVKYGHLVSKRIFKLKET